jgi:ABC-2 type transport system permease protein
MVICQTGPGVAVLAGPFVMLLLALGEAVATTAGLPRRDHADRSVEFWLSLPTSHSANLAVPIGAHLLLWPAAALLLGWLSGLVLGPALVWRIGGLQDLAGLPWAELIVGSGTLVLRVIAGLPLALLWVLPVLLLLMLLNAFVGRWGWVVLAAGLVLGGVFERLVFGQTLLAPTLKALLQNAALSLFGAGGPEHLNINSHEDITAKLISLPLAALKDFVAALGMLASPLLVGALLFSAACFYGLVRWRQVGAGAKD